MVSFETDKSEIHFELRINGDRPSQVPVPVLVLDGRGLREQEIEAIRTQWEIDSRVAAFRMGKVGMGNITVNTEVVQVTSATSFNLEFPALGNFSRVRKVKMSQHPHIGLADASCPRVNIQGRMRDTQLPVQFDLFYMKTRRK